MSTRRLSALGLAAALLLVTAAHAHAGQKRALSPAQKKEIRRDTKSLMGWSFRLFSGRNPRLRTDFHTLPNGRTAVTASLVARWQGQRSVQKQRSGEVVVDSSGAWSWVKDSGNPNTDLFGPTSPAASVAARESVVDNAVEVGRSKGVARVLYSATDRGAVLRIASVDTRTGRPIATGRNLARPVMSAARAAHLKRGANRPNNVVLGGLARDGKSIEVHVYWPLNAGLSTDFRTTYQVGLDRNGAPTGSVTQVAQTSVR